MKYTRRKSKNGNQLWETERKEQKKKKLFSRCQKAKAGRDVYGEDVDSR